MLEQYLKEEFVQCAIVAEDWKEAIRLAARPLVNSQKIEPSYVERTIQKVEELGPYIVLTKGVAVAHARPKMDVTQDCVSLATLKNPVSFGHSTNDPVSIVFILAATNDNGHIGAIMEVAQKLCEEGITKKILSARTTLEIFNLIVKASL